MSPLTLNLDGQQASSSFGNPTVQVEPSPTGSGKVLVVTTFVFSAGDAADDAGELLYYQPLGTR
jgi:hypothetical protein